MKIFTSCNISHVVSFMRGIPVFSTLDEHHITSAIDDGLVYIRDLCASEVVYDSSTPPNEIHPAIVYDGTLRVFSSDEDRDVCLKILNQGSLFGVTNVFSSHPQPISCIRAQKKAKIIVIKQDAFRRFIEENRAFMYGYFAFLSDRIEFLNKKIRQFTAGTAERRLAIYLDTLSDNDVFTLPIPYSKLCEMLDIGRASLYRAIDTLIEKGIISHDGKMITVHERLALRQYGYQSKNK